jgi:hypothetical protein
MEAVFGKSAAATFNIDWRVAARLISLNPMVDLYLNNEFTHL